MFPAGYILRITRKEWVEQVFDCMTYYTSLYRKWKPEQTILFVHKTDEGDSLIGFGTIGAIRDFQDFSEGEKALCAEHGWKRALDFSFIKKFSTPLLVKETFLAETLRRGRFLHGLALDDAQIGELLSQAGE